MAGDFLFVFLIEHSPESVAFHFVTALVEVMVFVGFKFVFVTVTVQNLSNFYVILNIMPGGEKIALVKFDAVAVKFRRCAARDLFELLVVEFFEFVIDFLEVFFACCLLSTSKLFSATYTTQNRFRYSLAEKFFAVKFQFTRVTLSP